MAHPDFDRLLDALLSFARLMIRKRGGFLPFGAAVKSDGEVTLDGSLAGDASDPAAEMLELLQTGLSHGAASGTIRAAGTCVQTRVQRPDADGEIDAIHAHLEHADGECEDVYLPYRRGWFGTVSYGETRSIPGERTLFVMGGSGAAAPGGAPPERASDERGSDERRHGGTAWDLELPAGWSFRDDGVRVTIAARPACGTLVLTERTLPGDVTESDALGLAAEDALATRDRDAVKLGEFSGLAAAGEVDGTWQRRWWVWRGRCLLCVTYGCSLTTKGLEDRGVDRILATLRVREPS